MIVGDQEDEGTLFALFQPNLTDTADVVDYLSLLFFQDATKEQLTTFVDLYPTDPKAGSPFRTDIFNEVYPDYKRLAAILGDLVFTLTRRVFLTTARAVNPSVPSWSYLASYDAGTPILGTLHGSDLLQTYYGLYPNNAMLSTRTYYFNFLYNQDPNVGAGKFSKWPEWSPEGQDLMWFQSPLYNGYLKDDFRGEAYQWITDNVHVLQV